MARQKMISTSKLGEIIDLMKAKGVAKITIPDTVEISLFEFATDANEQRISQFQSIVDSTPQLNDNVPMSDMDLLLHSAT